MEQMTNSELIESLRYCFEKRKTVVGVPWYVWCDRAADAIQEQQKQIAQLYILLNNRINEITKLEKDWEKAATIATEYEAKSYELEAHMPKWISVEDRLPQPRELVLVARKDGFVSLGYCFQFGENHLWSAIRLVPFSPYELPFVGAGHITHWMPLPDAPEG